MITHFRHETAMFVRLLRAGTAWAWSVVILRHNANRRASTALLCVLLHWSAAAPAADIVRPVADGTLSDGGVFGSFDGVVDRASWNFDSMSFSGAVSLITQDPASAVEHRTVFEYDLRGVTLMPPLVATLTFTTRGASVFPFPDVTVNVYSYPADLVESVSDFSAGPAILHGTVKTTAMQLNKTHVLDITDVVTAALSGDKKVAFRFQIDPDTTNNVSQAFVDALDSEPSTKPFITLRTGIRGDGDNDGDVDLYDLEIFTDCLAGPGVTPQPTMTDVSVEDCLWAFDGNGDEDVDLEDFSPLADLFLPH